MKLTEARTLFNTLRKQGKIRLTRHVLKDHQDRLFTKDEIFYLIQHTEGFLSDNNKSPTSAPGSFLYKCKDILGRDVQAAVMLEDNVIVIHIFRKV